MKQRIASYHIKPQSGVGFTLEAGQFLRLIDPLGEQVADFMAFARDFPGECLSSGRSIDYADTLYLTEGHVLYSQASRPLLTITEDLVGRHDFTLTPCSPDTFRLLYGTTGYHPSCFENLCGALAPFGIAPERIPVTFNAFMNVGFDPASGAMTIRSPLSKPGQWIEFRAECALYVGVTACSAEKSNNGSFKPIDVEVYAAD